jgi:hypothetical protein
MGTKILILGVLTLTALAVASATRPTTVPARRGGIYPPDSKIDVVLKQRLPAVRFRQVPLEEAVERLRSESGANLFTDWQSLKAVNVERSTKVDVDLQDISLAQALDYLIRSTASAEVAWDVQDNVIVISSDSAIGRNASVRVYDVRALMESEFAKAKARWDAWRSEHPPQKPPSPTQAHFGNGEPTWDEQGQALIRIITDHVAAETWKDNGGEMSIREPNGRLIIRQTWQNHQKVAAILDALREKGLPATRLSVPAAARPQGVSQ